MGEGRDVGDGAGVGVVRGDGKDVGEGDGETGVGLGVEGTVAVGRGEKGAVSVAAGETVGSVVGVVRDGIAVGVAEARAGAGDVAGVQAANARIAVAIMANAIDLAVSQKMRDTGIS